MKKLKLSCCSSKWSESEKEVAEILRDLYRISLLSSIPLSWICKRKRSFIQNNTSPSPNKRLCTFNRVVLKGEASSIKHSNITISLKKKKESSLKTIQDLTETKSLLHQEIENVKKYHIQLKIFNLNLKLKKQELLCKSNLENQYKVQLDDETNGLVKTSESTGEHKEQKNQLQNNGPFSIELGQNNNGPIEILQQLRLDREGLILENKEKTDGKNKKIIERENKTIIIAQEQK